MTESLINVFVFCFVVVIVVFAIAANSLVPADVTHCLIPDCQTTSDYLDILELSELPGIVFLQTVLHHVSYFCSKENVLVLKSWEQSALPKDTKDWSQ